MLKCAATHTLHWQVLDPRLFQSACFEGCGCAFKDDQLTPGRIGQPGKAHPFLNDASSVGGEGSTAHKCGPKHWSGWLLRHFACTGLAEQKGQFMQNMLDGVSANQSARISRVKRRRRGDSGRAQNRAASPRRRMACLEALCRRSLAGTAEMQTVLSSLGARLSSSYDAFRAFRIALSSSSSGGSRLVQASRHVATTRSSGAAPLRLRTAASAAYDSVGPAVALGGRSDRGVSGLRSRDAGLPYVAPASRQLSGNAGATGDADISGTVECVVVGAGVVGLAIARALALRGREVVVVEAAGAIGTETSSRHSEGRQRGEVADDNAASRVCR
ncbi:hypothetical protein TSOC_004076 [Tetrabaena socialis]|uniref:L-2-hydroxyglutarate dehydrogenase, mitochondrial n=1 Tax=Tetrabaena socialis TaxID=47790 RepID=A0A2J8A9W7_9CHLO|nr:hypothetical protein TSOC_004076 [Tetrabaena socialis]|eukprot:PNH09310.1 hypothetical protein TSOC_004076 [Tetrabaena socialis]